VPPSPQPPFPPFGGSGGDNCDYQSISDVVLFRLHLNNLSLLLLQKKVKRSKLEESRANTRFLLLLFLILFTIFRLMLVKVTLLFLQFEKCIANDICNRDWRNFSLSPGGRGPQTEKVGKVCLIFLPN
jgi:hypothetical protein